MCHRWPQKKFVLVFPKQLLNSKYGYDNLKFIQVHLELFKYIHGFKGMNSIYLFILFIEYNFMPKAL